jgi:transposase
MAQSSKTLYVGLDVHKESIAGTEQHERLQRLETELHDHVTRWRLYPVVEAIQALRGVDLTGAIIVIAELGDLTRFATPRQLMRYGGKDRSEESMSEFFACILQADTPLNLFRAGCSLS